MIVKGKLKLIKILKTRITFIKEKNNHDRNNY